MPLGWQFFLLFILSYVLFLFVIHFLYMLCNLMEVCEYLCIYADMFIQVHVYGCFTRHGPRQTPHFIKKVAHLLL